MNKKFYDFVVKSGDGSEVKLSDFAGKVVLVVNTATGCGFTPQYDGIEKLYEKYHDAGLEILDFPCNQFMNQAPGTDEEIHTFCTLHFGTKFPQMAKIDVNGANADPVYKFLKSQIGGDRENVAQKDSPLYKMLGAKNFFRKIFHFGFGAKNARDEIKWNFTKFLVSRDGSVVGRFDPTTTPEQLDAEIQKLL